MGYIETGSDQNSITITYCNKGCFSLAGSKEGLQPAVVEMKKKKRKNKKHI